MNPNDNNDRLPENVSAEINDKITRFGAILIAVAIILFCFSYTKITQSFLQIVLYVLSGLLAAIGLFIITVITLGARMEKHKTNFFLYNKKTKQTIPPAELTVQEARQRITEYMSAFKRRGKLYVGELFDIPMIPEYFKPLFCYELLCQIAEEGEEKAELFLSYGAECSEIFAKYLMQTDDYELARLIRGYVHEFSEKREIKHSFAGYLHEHKAQLEEKMLRYIVDNIDKF
ncbi:MAG: hypothetical protein IJY39_12820 [Clostridia bacterium]|nr:hypothetical protein [Clostridia bacterium]